MDGLALTAQIRPAVLLAEPSLRLDVQRLRLSDVLLTRLGQVVGSDQDPAGLPRVDTRLGSIYTDGGDATRHWYLPELRLVEGADPAFGFRALRLGADDQGLPFNTATLTLGVVTVEPADVTARRATDPTARLEPVPLRERSATLVVAYRDSAGSFASRSFAGQVAAATIPGGADTVTVAGLLGPDALLVFAALTETGSCTLELGYRYDAVSVVSPDRPRPKGPRWPTRRLLTGEAVQRLVLEPSLPASPATLDRLVSVDAIRPRLAGTNLALVHLERIEVRDADARLGVDRVAVDRVRLHRPDLDLPDLGWPVEGDVATPRVLHQVLSETPSLALEQRFAPTAYRPRYVLDTDGGSRVILSRDDLGAFSTPQSEFMELTALGPVSARYPSLQALYLGRVTGTVVAVPTAYGIARTREGLLAACDAVVDPSATSASGCRFHLTFGLVPLLGPSELLRLAADLAAEPSLSGRISQIVLPSRLAAGDAGLVVAGLAGLSVTAGEQPGSFLLAFDLADAEVPAVVAVNLLLRQLVGDPVPTLLGRLPLALDDAFATPLAAAVRLTLRDTSGGEDLAVAVAPDGSTTVSNLGPVELVVTTLCTRTPDGDVADRPVTLPLPAGASVAVPLAAGETALAADAELAVPPEGFDRHISGYVAITVATAQQVRHTVGINAAALFGAAVSGVEVAVSLDADPTTALPVFSLTAADAVQSTVWQLPLATAMASMPATVTVTVRAPDGSVAVHTLAHDFSQQPVLLLTSDLASP